MKLLTILIVTPLLGLLAIALVSEDVRAYRGRGVQVVTYSPPPPAEMPAAVVLQVPAETKVFFDDAPTTSTGTVRTYNTPPLPPGEFSYEVKAVLMHEGKELVAVRQVKVSANLTTSVDLTAELKPPVTTQVAPAAAADDDQEDQLTNKLFRGRLAKFLMDKEIKEEIEKLPLSKTLSSQLDPTKFQYDGKKNLLTWTLSDGSLNKKGAEGFLREVLRQTFVANQGGIDEKQLEEMTINIQTTPKVEPGKEDKEKETEKEKTPKVEPKEEQKTQPTAAIPSYYCQTPCSSVCGSPCYSSSGCRSGCFRRCR